MDSGKEIKKRRTEREGGRSEIINKKQINK